MLVTRDGDEEEKIRRGRRNSIRHDEVVFQNERLEEAGAGFIKMGELEPM